MREARPRANRAERARRDGIYARGGEKLRTGPAEEARREGPRPEKIDAAHAAEEVRAARLASMAERRMAGLCLNCGGPIDAHPGPGRQQMRCERCRMGG